MSAPPTNTVSPVRYLSFAAEPKSDEVGVDLDRLIETRSLTQGASGSGKSTLLRAMLEQTHGRVQHLVIDREGDFVTLREKFAYLIVGRDGDVPADPRTAALLVRHLMEWRTSAIFDLSELRVPAQRDWVKNALDELVALPRELWEPVLVVLDEAPFFAPQNGLASSTEAVIAEATVGRKRNQCLCSATQRMAPFNNGAMLEHQNRFIGITDGEDLARAASALGWPKSESLKLQQLEPHQFYAVGPAVSRFPVLVQTPPTITRPPAKGKARPPVAPPPAEVKKLVEQLQGLAQESEEEARTTDELRAQVARLRSELATQRESGAATSPKREGAGESEAKINALREAVSQ